MQQETLYYHKGIDEFYFKSMNPNMEKVHRIRHRFFKETGPVLTFPGGYPMGLVSLKDFKAICPEGRAAKSALEQIDYLKSVPDQLGEFSRVNSFNYNFRVAPYVHQMVAMEYMLHFDRLGLVLAMGLGKTFVSVHYIDMTKRKTLVFGPVIVMETWMKEIRKYTDLKVVLYRGTHKQRGKIRDSIMYGDNQDWDIIVSNFEGPVPTKKDKEDYYFYNGLDFDCVIIDEASRLLGHKSERGQVIYDLANTAKYRYLLSGTLSKGKPTDMFMPFKIMDPAILGSNYWSFRQKYCVFSKYNKHVITGYKNLDDLKMRIDPYLLTMERDDCLDLPPRTFVREEYEMSKEQYLVYETIKSEEIFWLPLNGKLLPEFDGPSPDTHGELRCGLTVIKLNKLRQVLSGFLIMSPERDYRKCNDCSDLLTCINPKEGSKEIFPWDKDLCTRYDPENPVRKPDRQVLFFKENPKLELLKELLIDLGVDNDRKTKVIIWAEYKVDIQLITAMLIQQGITFVTPATKNCESAFQDDPDNLVFLGQVSEGVGITLTQAKVTINYSYSLDLDHRLQSLERNYRIGQNNKVLVKDLVHPESVESGVLSLLDKKEDVKDFMQGTNVCTRCSSGKRVQCLEDQVWPYAKDCIHYEKRQEAEKKRSIKIV